MKSLQDFYGLEGIKKELIAPYTPQPNGVAERCNGTTTEPLWRWCGAGSNINNYHTSFGWKGLPVLLTFSTDVLLLHCFPRSRHLMKLGTVKNLNWIICTFLVAWHMLMCLPNSKPSLMPRLISAFLLAIVYIIANLISYLIWLPIRSSFLEMLFLIKI